VHGRDAAGGSAVVDSITAEGGKAGSSPQTSLTLPS
jgi:hypothetical protein